MNFSVVLPRVKWWRCLNEIAECLTMALRVAGHGAEIDSKFPAEPWSFRDDAGRKRDTHYIAIGAHRESVELPDYPVIVYQSEVPGSRAFPPSYAEKLKRALCVWDSAPGYGTGSAVVEPGLYETRKVGETLWDEDIDLLFYGSLTERRIELLTKLQDAGLAPSVHFNVFGAERNALIDRAKVIVDIKQRADDPNDKTRTFFLDSRGACVLTENDTDPKRALTPAAIVQQCKTLLQSEEMRRVHVASRRAELKPTDVTAGIAALERALAGNQRRGNGHVAHHPV